MRKTIRRPVGAGAVQKAEKQPLVKIASAAQAVAVLEAIIAHPHDDIKAGLGAATGDPGAGEQVKTVRRRAWYIGVIVRSYIHARDLPI